MTQPYYQMLLPLNDNILINVQKFVLGVTNAPSFMPQDLTSFSELAPISNNDISLILLTADFLQQNV